MDLLSIFRSFLKPRKELQENKAHQDLEALSASLSQETTMPIQKTFDVIIHEYDADGHPTQKMERGVLASSRKELVSLYEMCGQKIEIISEYSSEQKKEEVLDVSQLPPDCKILKMPEIPGLQGQAKQDEVKEESTSLQPAPECKHENTMARNYARITSNEEFSLSKKKDPPKYYNLSGIEIKIDDGKMYQKQWVKIVGNESNNYRLISDSSNKIISLQGKHLEMLKWILVEDNPIDDTHASIQSILNS